MTIKIRFTIFFVFLVTVLTFVFSFLVYRQVESRLISQVESNLTNFLEHEIEHWEKQENHTADFPTNGLFLKVEKNGNTIFSSVPKDDIKTRQKLSIQTIGEDSFTFTAYQDLKDIHSYLDTLKAFFIATGVVMLLLTAPLAFAAAWLLLFPFRVLARATSEFSADNLSRRISVPRYLDEYGLLTSSFNSLFERLEGSFDEIQRYAQSVSHEFRTPVSIIAAQAESALKKDPSSSPQNEALHKILNQARKLDMMASHLLTLGDIRRWSRDSAISSPVNITSTAQELALSIQKKPWASTKAFSLNVPPEVNPSKLRLNEQLFMTVVGNLLDNAFYFAQTKVSLRAETVDGYVEICVEDDGTGIPEQQRRDVFQPFYTRRKGGHGLGLTIVKAALEATNGKIQLSDSSLGGLAIRALFPIVAS